MVAEGKAMLDSVRRDFGTEEIEGPDNYRVEDEDHSRKESVTMLTRWEGAAHQLTKMRSRYGTGWSQSAAVREGKRGRNGLTRSCWIQRTIMSVTHSGALRVSESV